MDHSSEIVDQFTRQARPFVQAPGARNPEIIACILRMAQPAPALTALDEARIRAMIEPALTDDCMDVQSSRERDTMRFSFPMAVLSVQVPHAH